MVSLCRGGCCGESRCLTAGQLAIAEGRQKIQRANIGYDGGVRALLCLLAATWLRTACGGQNTEAELRGRLEGFFEAVLTGDAASLDDFVSDSCAEKAEFLRAASEAPAFEEAEVEVPTGAFSFDIEGDVAVAKRSAGSEPVLIDGEPLEDDPTNDVPLKLVEDDGVWRVEDYLAYTLG